MKKENKMVRLAGPFEPCNEWMIPSIVRDLKAGGIRFEIVTTPQGKEVLRELRNYATMPGHKEKELLR